MSYEIDVNSVLEMKILKPLFGTSGLKRHKGKKSGQLGGVRTMYARRVIAINLMYVQL